QLQEGAIDAIAVYAPDGSAVARVGPPELVDLLPEQRTQHSKRSSRDVSTRQGPALMIFRPDRDGGVATLTRVDRVTTRALSLTRLIALYMGLGALAVVAFAYLGLTRQIVQPILHLRRAAERVAQGGRRLELPRAPAGELRELGLSLTQMTD